jgi:Flp pilus assembly protein TadD
VGRRRPESIVGVGMKLTPFISACLALVVAACGLDADGVASRGDSYSASVQRADEARKAGAINEAIPLYGRALQVNPDGVEAKLGLGQSYLALGASDEAAAQFRDVLAKRSGDNVARRGLASALLSMGQPALAVNQLVAALQADASDYRALNAMGVALDMEGQHEEAQARYREGIAIAPDFLALRSNLGLSLAISGRGPEAVAQLAPLAGGRGADARIRQNLAFAYAMSGDPTNALVVSRHDLTEASAQRQLSYYLALKNLPILARSAEIRRNPNFFPQSSPRAASG